MENLNFNYLIFFSVHKQPLQEVEIGAICTEIVKVALPRSFPFPICNALIFFLQALCYLHANKRIHRDVKGLEFRLVIF